MLVLLNDEVVCVGGQSLHHLSGQVSKQPIGLGLSSRDLTMWSLMLLSFLKATIGEGVNGNGFEHILSDLWRVGRCFRRTDDNPDTAG